jgi:hypothetical protein
MKKLLESSRSVTLGALLPSLAVVLGVVFWGATTSLVNAQGATRAEQTAGKDKPGKDKPGKGGGASKCDVCHNPHNYHTVSIPCDQVDKFLANHPGDFRVRCEATPVTNP